MAEQVGTVVVGASAAGLACARALQERGVAATVLEKHPQVANSWRNHYERLHLHTPKSGSALPHMKMPSDWPRYPARLQVVEYLERYAETLDEPPRFGIEVTSVSRGESGWITETTDGSFRSDNVIIATGYTRVPVRPVWPGMDEYRGTLLHSSEYKNGQAFEGRPVLVIGFGNSACEIAICLHEHGASPSMSVRSAVNVIPRDILGIPVLTLGILQSRFPSRLADVLNAPLMRLTVGDITKHGLRKLPYGAITQVKEHDQIPLLDIGTMDLIKSGEIAIRPGVAAFTEAGVEFTDGTTEDFDAVILGTGYRPAVGEILVGCDDVFDREGTPYVSGKATAQPGLYFCGFHVVPSGGLREIGIEAKRLADVITS